MCHTLTKVCLSHFPLQIHLVTHTWHNTHTHTEHKNHTQKHTQTHIITPQTNKLMASAALSFCQTIMFHDADSAPNSHHSCGWLNPLLTVTPQQTQLLAFPSAHRPQDKHSHTTFCPNKCHNLLWAALYKDSTQYHVWSVDIQVYCTQTAHCKMPDLSVLWMSEWLLPPDVLMVKENHQLLLIKL